MTRFDDVGTDDALAWLVIIGRQTHQMTVLSSNKGTQYSFLVYTILSLRISSFLKNWFLEVVLIITLIFSVVSVDKSHIFLSCPDFHKKINVPL